MIPTIYLLLVYITTTLHLYSRNDKKELIEFLENFSNFEPIIKNKQYKVMYKKCIDISGTLKLKKNIIYKLDIDIEIYCYNNLDEKFKNIEVNNPNITGFRNNFFISDFFNFYMYLNLFTLTGLLYCYYK